MTAIEVMLAGHKAILKASTKAVLANRADFLLPIDDGALRCQVDLGLSGEHKIIFPRANSWLPSWMPVAASRQPTRLRTPWALTCSARRHCEAGCSWRNPVTLMRHGEGPVSTQGGRFFALPRRSAVGHEERFPLPMPNGRYRFRKRSRSAASEQAM
jgi:hypothetical protein